jgi:hypothetical protein
MLVTTARTTFVDSIMRTINTTSLCDRTRTFLLSLQKERWISIEDITAPEWSFTIHTHKAHQLFLAVMCVYMYALRQLTPWDTVSARFYAMAKINRIYLQPNLPECACFYQEAHTGLAAYYINETPVHTVIVRHRHFLL